MWLKVLVSPGIASGFSVLTSLEARGARARQPNSQLYSLYGYSTAQLYTAHRARAIVPAPLIVYLL